ncbi:C-C motif chemokine 4-like [Embiotoca jacksoni]|uniref:C-C motif chemokine 4-like n=1 Tax=Embiotoca jacksoni TaxID=100190 RepID=UPI0037043293
MMTMMKNPVILVTCILLFSTLTVLASQNGFGPKDCCFMFISHRLDKNKVVDFDYTDKMCSMESVLFTMKNGNKLCVDPSIQWVQNIIKAKEKLQASK